MEPVLICPIFKATAKSAINVSSLSPERCEIIGAILFLMASSIQSKVSLKVPIWFNLIKILLL